LFLSPFLNLNSTYSNQYPSPNSVREYVETFYSRITTNFALIRLISAL